MLPVSLRTDAVVGDVTGFVGIGFHVVVGEVVAGCRCGAWWR